MDYKAEYEIMKQQFEEANESSRHFQKLLEAAEVKNAVLAKQLEEGGLITPSIQELNELIKSLKEFTTTLSIYPGLAFSEKTMIAFDDAVYALLEQIIKKFG